MFLTKQVMIWWRNRLQPCLRVGGGSGPTLCRRYLSVSKADLAVTDHLVRPCSPLVRLCHPAGDQSVAQQQVCRPRCRDWINWLNRVEQHRFYSHCMRMRPPPLLLHPKPPAELARPTRPAPRTDLCTRRQPPPPFPPLHGSWAQPQPRRRDAACRKACPIWSLLVLATAAPLPIPRPLRWWAKLCRGWREQNVYAKEHVRQATVGASFSPNK